MVLNPTVLSDGVIRVELLILAGDVLLLIGYRNGPLQCVDGSHEEIQRRLAAYKKQTRREPTQARA